MKNLVPVIRKQTPYRIETAISKAQNVVHIWAGIFQAKKIVGPIFWRVSGFPFYDKTLSPSDQEKNITK